LMAREIIF